MVTECATDGVRDRVLVDLVCHGQAEQVAGPKRMHARPPVAAGPQFQVGIVGFGLRGERPGKRSFAPVPAGQPSRFDFTPGARTIDSLRWTWASAAWKF